MSDTQSRLASALSDRYRVERELGAGGMATVYLAHDLRHEREVAIKVLHPDLGAALGGERFLAEIKTTAKLQHPHILGLIDSGAADGLLFFVMPFVAGETLRARIQREGQLPVNDAVRLAREVAAALDFAHRQGVVHRDIKPENILLQDGSALVADFGIALAVQSAGGQRMTQTGLSLGTPQYMAPEQATGERIVDARADVYALAAVTYEMLVGEPPFTGPSIQAVVARLLSEQPRPIGAQRKAVPMHVEAAVLQGLEKLPADRFATAAEFAEALRGGTGARLLSSGTMASAGAPTRGAGASRWWVAPVVGVMGVALGAGATWLAAREGDAPVGRQQVVLWQRPVESGTNLYRTQADLSADGTLIAFSDSLDGTRRIYLKARAAEGATAVPGSEGGVSPAFSPDGKWLGFMTQEGALKKVALEGGAPITLVPRVDGVHRLLEWLDDGSLLYSATGASVMRVSAEGAELRRYPLSVSFGASADRLVGLPGAKGVLFSGCDGNCSFGSYTAVLDLASGKERRLLQSRNVLFSATGHLLSVAAGGRVTATPFDPETLAPAGEAVTVLDGPVTTMYAISESGSLLYSVNPTVGARTALHWLDRDGRVTEVDSSWKQGISSPRIAPDGRTVAVHTAANPIGVVIRSGDGVSQQLRAPGNVHWRAEWMDRGRSIAFIGRLGEARSELVAMRAEADGSGARVWIRDPGGVAEVAVADDNSWMAYRGTQPDGTIGVFVRRVTGDTTPTRILDDVPRPIILSVSPDGRWLAYANDETGRPEVYVTSIPDGRVRRQVSREGGSEPRFSRSGKELFFIADRALMAVPITNAETFSFGAPTRLFSVEGYRRAPNRQQWDVAPGDQQFVFVKGPPAPPVPPLVLAENWFTELKGKLPR